MYLNSLFSIEPIGCNIQLEREKKRRADLFVIAPIHHNLQMYLIE